MAKLKLPFELEKPSVNEYVTQASEVGYNNASVADTLAQHGQNINKSATTADSETGGDLDISDPNGYVIGRFAEGHIKTKNFDSRNVCKNADVVDDDSNAYLDISDAEGNVIGRFAEGHFQTKEFDSRNVCKNADVVDDDSNADLDISDVNGNVILQLKGGHLKTKEFDSRDVIPAPVNASVDDINLVMPNLLYKIAAIERGESKQCVIGLLGDSWTQHNGAPYLNPHSDYITPFVTYLRTKYGNAGGGFYSFGISHGNFVSKMASAIYADADDTRSSDETSGHDTITYYDQVEGTKWIDATHQVFHEGAWLLLNVKAAHSVFVIHFFGQAGGGKFTYALDGGSAIEVDTSQYTGHSMITINTNDATHTLRFDEISGDSIIYGVDMQRENAGVRVHKLGNKGATTSSFVIVDANEWKDSVESLNLDTMTILLGTNDGPSNSSVGTNLKTIMQRVRSVNTYIDLCLIQPSDNASGNGKVMYNQSKQQKSAAVEMDVGFINLRPLFGSPQQILAKGTFAADGLHPNYNGGRLIADYLLRKLFLI